MEAHVTANKNPPLWVGQRRGSDISQARGKTNRGYSSPGLPEIPELNKAARRRARLRANIAMSPDEVARADAVIAALARLWPKCFFTAPSKRRPLMIGIDRELIVLLRPAIDAGRVSENDIRLALKRYTTDDAYLRRCIKRLASRIGLNGEKTGIVDRLKHAHYAACLLAAPWRMRS
jgi:hypothetical protein